MTTPEKSNGNMTVSQAANVAELQAEYGYSIRQLEVIKNTVAKGATLPELHHFLTVAKLTGLNPFLRQIYFVIRKQGDQMVPVIQVGIDGYRSLADRTGSYAGNDDADFEYRENGDIAEYPAKAMVTVYKMVGGVRCPFTASARWEQYYPGDGKKGFMWRKMPELMLAKCAEALALRKAFPAQLSGLYTHEEMEQAGTGGPELDPSKEVMCEAPQATSEEEIEAANTKSEMAPESFD
jgi:phage recombination protein Bet